MKRMSKNVMLALGAINLVLAVATYFSGHAGYGIAETVSFSRVRDLQVHHAIGIDSSALTQIANAGLSDPLDVHPFLTGGFRDLLVVFNGAALALLLNAAMWTFAGYRKSRGMAVPQPAQSSAPADKSPRPA
jgi:hypothetical protein